MTAQALAPPLWMQRAGQFLWWCSTPVRGVWAEVIGLRTEELRSLASVGGIAMALAGFVVMLRDDLGWMHPVVAFTFVCLFLTGAIAGYAMHGKIRHGEKLIELRVDPDARNRSIAESTAPAPGARAAPVASPKVDDPEGETS